MRPEHDLPGLVPSATQHLAHIVEQQQLARDTYRLRVHCPELARQIVPGQFFMIKAAGTDDPLLGRPFALYDVYSEGDRPAGVDFGYVVVGKLTSLMSDWTTGDQVEIWGPLGNGFPIPSQEPLLMIAGGIGQTPFLAVAREALGIKEYGMPQRSIAGRPQRLTLCYGVRSAEYLAGLDDFTMDSLDVQIATDDGSSGHHGLVTDLLAQQLEGDTPPKRVYACGPVPMMKAAAGICARAGVACWLSLETPMACGFGACFSCVTKVREEDGNWDYRRTCVEGPVFRADQLIL